MKRSRGGGGNSSRQRVISDTKEISGQIEELVFPKLAEYFTGFFVGRIAGLPVVGSLPFLDRYFIYNLHCTLETSKFGIDQWKIVRMGKPGYEPVPLNFNLLQIMLREQEGCTSYEAQALIMQLERRVAGQLADPQRINPDQLMHVLQPDPPDWLVTLANQSILFKYNSLKNLTFYWKTEDLSHLTMEELVQLNDEVSVDIARFCFRTSTMFDLPEVGYKEAVFYYQLNGRPEPAWLRDTAQFYESMKSFTGQTKSLALSPGIVVDEWRCGRGMATALKRGISKVVTLCDVDGRSYARLMLDDHARDLHWVADKLNQLQDRPVDELKPLASARVSLEKLNPEQRVAVESIFKTNLLIVTGVAGTGKTTAVAKKIFEYFGKKKSMPLAYYGAAAAGFRAVLGKGMTVHKLISRIQKQEINSEKIELVLMDEASTGTLDLLKMILSLPNLKKLVLFGDPRQMSPPTPGPILRDLLLRYKKTPIVCKLKQIMRVTGQSERAVLHRDILNRLYKKDFNVPFSRQLDSDAPFVVLPRIDDVDKLAGIKKSLQPLIDSGSPFQTLAQRNEEVALCNRAIFNHLYTREKSYSPTDLLVGEKVMLLENFDDVYVPKDERNGQAPMDYDRNKDPKWVLRTDELTNGEVSRITAIWDIDTESLKRTARENTGGSLQSKSCQRIIKLENGKQLNLRRYSPLNVTRGECCTVAKSQGLQYPTSVMYIHKDFSKTLSQRQLTTAVGRGSERFVIICAPFQGDSLEGSEIATILKTPEAEVEAILAVLLKPYSSPRYSEAVQQKINEEVDHFLLKDGD